MIKTPQPPPVASASNQDYPTLTISAEGTDYKYAEALLTQANLHHLMPKTEVWNIEHSSRELSYLTHNMFRFFGKFPPPIARHLIERYTEKNDSVYDAMVGSGTTAIEALQVMRKIFCSDVSPLSELLTRVKCQPINAVALFETLDRLKALYFSSLFRPTVRTSEVKLSPERLAHWFLKETVDSLRKLLSAIRTLDNRVIYDFFLCCFISIVRKVSRATTQQGRLFLDHETAIKKPWPMFEKVCLNFIESVSHLPSHFSPPHFILSDLRAIPSLPASPTLVICHPPYFNVYKFSRIFTLELAWLGVYSRNEVSKKEVREFFKVGKPDNVHKYVNDMRDGILNIASLLKSDTIFALMIGDTRIHGNHIPTTSLLLDSLANSKLKVISFAIRKPKYTEASWVASQRRTGKKVGIHLSDYIITFRCE